MSVTKDLMPHLVGHTFVHILNTPLRSTKNGALLHAVASDYDVFLTMDKSIRHQQKLKRFPIAFVILRARSNRLADLLPLVPDTLAVLDRIAGGRIMPGELYGVA